MKTRILALLLFVFALLSANAAVTLQMDLAFFGANPTTNRTVTLNPQTPFPGNTLYAYSDTNGIAYLSNCPSGLINGVIMAPPGRITFQVNILLADSGLINASNRLASGSSTTYPAGQVAWAIATSDQRYQLSGTTLSNTFYPLYSNPSNYLTLATNPKQTNGFTTIVFSNPAAFLPVSGTNGLIGFLQASNVAFYIYTNNPSNYVNQAQLTAATNGLTAGLTNGFASTNFVLSTVAIASNALSSASTTASNVLAAGIIGATNGIKSAAYSNSTAFILTNALPNLTNSFYPLFANPSNYISSFTNAVTASITNGFAGTNYVNASSAIVSNTLVSTGILISNGVMNNLTASNLQIQANIGATNTAEIARVTAQIDLTNSAIRSAMILTNTANLVITTNIFGVSTNYANTNAMRLIAASNAVVLITVSNNLANATNNFVVNTNGSATSLTLASNAYFGSPVAQTLQLNGTPYLGLTGAGNTGVNGTYGKQTSSIWTNFVNPNYTVILSGGIYYAQSNSVSLYAFASLPSTNGTIVSPGINPVPALTLGWTFNLNGGVFNGEFNSTNLNQKIIGYIAANAITNNSQQQITLFNTNNIYYGTLIGTNAVNSTNATYLGGLYYTNYVTFGSIGGGYLTNNNNIVISGEVAGSGTTNIVVNPTATFTNDVNSLAQAIATASTNGLITAGATNSLNSTNLYGTISNARLSSSVVTNGRPNVRLGGMNITDWTTYQTIQPSNSLSYIQFQNSALINLAVEGGDGVIDEGFFAATNGSIFLQTYNLVNSGLESFTLGTNGILSLSNAVYSGNALYLTNIPYAKIFSSTNGAFTSAVNAVDGSTNWAFRLTNTPAQSVVGSVTNAFISVNATNSQQSLIANVATNGATVSAGANVTVTPTINANGTTNYAIASIGGSVSYPFAATTATNGATVSAGDATIVVTPSANANGTTNYSLVANVAGGSATNAIALLNGFGTNTTLVTAKSITTSNLTLLTGLNANGLSVSNLAGVSPGFNSLWWGSFPISQRLGTFGENSSLGYWRSGDGLTNYQGSWMMSAFNTTALGDNGAFGFLNTFNGNVYIFHPNGLFQSPSISATYYSLNGKNLTNWSDAVVLSVTNTTAVSMLGLDALNRVTTNAVPGGGSIPSGLVTNNVAGVWTNLSGIIQTNPAAVNVFGGRTNFPTYFNVLSYGAVGDGVTDDTASISNAYAAANLKGGTVYFPAPLVSYKLTQTINITNNVRTLGDIAGVPWWWDTNIVKGSCIEFDTSNSVMFRVTSTLAQFENIAFLNTNTVYVSGCFVQQTNNITTMYYDHCFFEGGYNGIEHYGNSLSQVRGSIFSDQRHYGVYASNLFISDAGDWVIDGCLFQLSSGVNGVHVTRATAGIYLNSSGGVKISNTTMNSSYTNDIVFDCIPSPTTTSIILVTGCSLENYREDSILGLNNHSATWDYLTIAGNHFAGYNSTGYAVNLNNTGNYSYIGGNTVISSVAGCYRIANTTGVRFGDTANNLTSPLWVDGGGNTAVYDPITAFTTLSLTVTNNIKQIVNSGTNSFAAPITAPNLALAGITTNYPLTASTLTLYITNGIIYNIR